MKVIKQLFYVSWKSYLIVYVIIMLNLIVSYINKAVVEVKAKDACCDARIWS